MSDNEKLNNDAGWFDSVAQVLAADPPVAIAVAESAALMHWFGALATNADESDKAAECHVKGNRLEVLAGGLEALDPGVGDILTDLAGLYRTAANATDDA